MKTHHKGIHHITALAGDPQRNADFYMKTLGLRLVKKSVNQDDPGTYHLFYGNRSASPGSSLTFFPWPRVVKGKPGTGEAVNVSFAVPERSQEFWEKRLRDKEVEIRETFKQFGHPSIRFSDPDGMELDLVFTGSNDSEDEMPDVTIPAEHAIRGFWGTRLWLDEKNETASLLNELFGFKETAAEGNRTLCQTNAPVGQSVIIETTEPQRGQSGRGIIHHVAFRAEDQEELGRLRQKVQELGFQPTPIIDRHWFKSVYFRESGGVLFEMATDGPGYDVDEDPDHLGEKLILPPWLESRRKEIEQTLPELEL